MKARDQKALEIRARVNGTVAGEVFDMTNDRTKTVHHDKMSNSAGTFQPTPNVASSVVRDVRFRHVESPKVVDCTAIAVGTIEGQLTFIDVGGQRDFACEMRTIFEKVRG